METIDWKKCNEIMKLSPTFQIFQAHLDIEVPSYFAANDPLLTYATPLNSNEEHTTTREELIGKCKTVNIQLIL